MTKELPRLLWIEDDDNFIKKMQYAFLGDYIIQPAIDLSQARAFLLGGNKYDLIMLDIELGDKTIGTEVFNHINGLKELSKTPLIIVSAESELEVAVNAMKKEANDYFYKGKFDHFNWKNKIDACIEKYKG